MIHAKRLRRRTQTIQFWRHSVRWQASRRSSLRRTPSVLLNFVQLVTRKFGSFRTTVTRSKDSDSSGRRGNADERTNDCEMSPRGPTSRRTRPKKTADRLDSSREVQQKEPPALRRSSHSKAASVREPPPPTEEALQKSPSKKVSVSQKAPHPKKKSKITRKEKIKEEAVTKNGSSPSIKVKIETDAGDDTGLVKAEKEVSRTKRKRRLQSPEEEPSPEKVAPVDTKTVQVKREKMTNRSSKFIGAHVSISGGLEHAVTRAVELGARAFGLFLRSQRQWACKPLSQESADRFRKACCEHNFAPHQILPHGSYLLNCGSPDPAVLEKSRATLVDELKRCEMLGLLYYNFHPGSTCGTITAEECMDRIAESIDLAHKETACVVTVIENMCKQGHTIGGDFRELRGIVDRVKDKSRIGVCLDTCHAFAAGYDVSTKEGFEDMMNDFDSVVGLSYLKAFHLNDSKGKLGSHLDRHENIGKGFIGTEGFRRIVNDSRFDSMPMILETPEMDYAKEIALLYDMCS